MRRHAAALLAVASIAWPGGPAAAQGRSFRAEGTDTGAGIGPRWIAQGGTGVSTADDVHAIYYNPAGLAEVKGFELAVSRQAGAPMHPVNFLGAAWRLPLPESTGWRASVAAAYYPRIHARASGAYSESDFESLFLRYLLPGISGTFDGDIDTKTKSYRLGFGATPGGAWSFGGYVERIDCQSTFCGVHATSNGFTTQSTGAKAIGAGVGVRWQHSPDWTFAASLSELHTRLDVQSTITDAAGTRSSRVEAQFPRKLAVGAAWHLTADLHAAAEYEVMKGRYGSSEIDLQMLRAGGEWRRGAWSWRAGAVAPLRIQSSTSGRLSAPFPLAPTVGVGWTSGPVRVDVAVYAHAVMSMHRDKPVPAADLGLSLTF